MAGAGAAGAAPVAARGDGDGARMSSPCPCPGAASTAVAKTAPARRISRGSLAMVLLGSIVAWPAMGNRRVAWTVKGWRAGSARAKLAGPVKLVDRASMTHPDFGNTETVSATS